MEQVGSEVNLLVEIVNAIGVVGLLAFMVIAFYRGDLVARSLLDRILSLYEQQLAELSERVLERLDRALSNSRRK